jgi:hypothetical protein
LGAGTEFAGSQRRARRRVDRQYRVRSSRTDEYERYVKYPEGPAMGRQGELLPRLGNFNSGYCSSPMGLSSAKQ